MARIQAQKKKSSPWMAWLLAVLLVVGLAVAAWFMFGNEVDRDIGGAAPDQEVVDDPRLPDEPE